jgi:hypothetical protein
MAPFWLAVFLSAFLLFQIQPLIARYILPWYGGTPRDLDRLRDVSKSGC